MPESKRRKPKNTGPTQSRTANPILQSEDDPSPTWYVALMAGLMIAGTLLVLARFVFRLDQYTLIIGLGLIAAGFFMTTNYR